MSFRVNRVTHIEVALTNLFMYITCDRYNYPRRLAKTLRTQFRVPSKSCAGLPKKTVTRYTCHPTSVILASSSGSDVHAGGQDAVMSVAFPWLHAACGAQCSCPSGLSACICRTILFTHVCCSNLRHVKNDENTWHHSHAYYTVSQQCGH